MERPAVVSESGKKKMRVRKREYWRRKIDFLFACLGFSVGLGNVWRFPYLCYKNGGGAFLIPYFICAIIGGFPLFFLEVSIGQFMNVSGLGAWNICPLFQGIGIATSFVMFYGNCYYNVILAWAYHYLFASFTSQLPWTSCGNWWNTKNCVILIGNDTTQNAAVVNHTESNETIMKIDPLTEYWENRVLGISSGIGDMGTVKWDLALCLLFAWIVVYLCICKGIKSSGKVMYFTVTFPYIFMIILLINGALLPGAMDGVIFYLKPDFTRLMDMKVWVDAGTQIFYSYSIAFGAITTLGSFNNFHHNSYRDSIIFACANSATSILSGFIIFPALGNMAKTLNKNISDVAESGPGLVFIAYPNAVSSLPLAPLWSSLFFLMIISVGLDSQFFGVESVVAVILDQWPRVLRVGRRPEVVTGAVCIVSFFIGLPMVTNGGMYVFQLFDYYSGSRVLILVGGFECVAVAWCYGIHRFNDNIEMMLGFRVNKYVLACWTVLSPLFCLTLFIMATISYSELSYVRPTVTYEYPMWAVAIGWSLTALSAVWIPGLMLHKVIKYCRSIQDLRLLIKPYGLKDHQLRPIDVGERTLKDLENNRRVLDPLEPSLSHENNVPLMTTQ